MKHKSTHTHFCLFENKTIAHYVSVTDYGHTNFYLFQQGIMFSTHGPMIRNDQQKW